MRSTANRTLLVILLIFALVLGVLSASVYLVSVAGLHLASQTDLQEISDEYLLTTTEIQSSRGSILDRNGNIIAQDVTSYTLYAIVKNTGDNSYVEDKETTAVALQPFLDGLSVEKILEILNTEELYQVYFGTPGKYLTLDQKNAITALNLPGIRFDEIVKRNYPNGEFASHLIGVAQYDESTKLMVGSFGLESAFNSYLTGQNGYLQYQAAKGGILLPQIEVERVDASNGSDVTLTLDKSIQETLEKTLTGYVSDIDAEAAWAAVMEVDTGKVIAWGQTPSFDPNDMATIESYQNIGSQWAYEPGSTMKTFTYAAAIDSGNYNGDSTFDSSTFYIGLDDEGNPIRSSTKSTAGGAPINNAGYTNYGIITFDKGYVYSSNVGIAEIMVNNLSSDIWLNYIKAFGFLEKVETAEQLPEENTTVAYDSVRDRISVGYGQGITVTMLQMLQAYSAVLSDGTMVKPYFVEKITDSSTNETIYEGSTAVVGNPIKASTALAMQALMYRVVNDSDGTAQRYKIDGVDILGKTGTAQVVVNGAYSSSTYIFSVALGMPADDPEILIYYAYKAEIGYDLSKNADKVKELMRKVAVSYGMLSSDEESETQPVDTTTMGSFINKTVNDAKSELSGEFASIMYLGSGKQVLDQYPQAGTAIMSNARIFILTSYEDILIPDFNGYSYKDIQAFSLITKIPIEITGDGYVISQSISANSSYDGSSTIEVVLE